MTPEQRLSVPITHGIPESFWEKLKAERPDGLNWDRVDDAFNVLRKPPEPEPTPTQKWARKVFESHDQNPYKSREGKWQAHKDAVKTLVIHPVDFFRDVREWDKKLRGGRDLGSISDRIERSSIFTTLMLASMGVDLFASETFFMRVTNALRKNRNSDPITSPKEHRVANTLRFATDIVEDKFVVGLVNVGLEQITGDKKFVSEWSEQFSDFINKAFPEYADVANGTAVECFVRVLSQFPITGSVIENVHGAITRRSDRNSLTKGLGKAIAIGAGVYLQPVFNLNFKPTLSERVWDRLWPVKAGG